MKWLAITLLTSLVATCVQEQRSPNTDQGLGPLPDRHEIGGDKNRELGYTQRSRLAIPIQTIGVVSAREDLSWRKNYSIVVMERGRPENGKLCEALFTILQDSDAAQSWMPSKPGLPIVFQETLWPDQRSVADVRKYRTGVRAEKDCEELASYDNFDFDRGRSIASDVFSLFGSHGPWILSVNGQHQKSVLLDFSGYSEAKYSAKVEKWKKGIAENSSFWSDKGEGVQHAIGYLTEYFWLGNLKIKHQVPSSDLLRPTSTPRAP
jgi:hypothetical protein